jgi:hypothetical protein
MSQETVELIYEIETGVFGILVITFIIAMIHVGLYNPDEDKNKKAP